MNKLDAQLEASLSGDFDRAWELCLELENSSPEHHGAAFNRGWFLLRHGKLSEGHKLLDRGRLINVFGDKSLSSKKPLWRGESGTVLMGMEGGLGDQIKSFRFVSEIEELGNQVVVACSTPLVELFSKQSYAVDHDSAVNIHHDYYLPSMSAVLGLGYEYEDIKGTPYIDKPKIPRNDKFRVGLRWSGNPTFEHEQFRKFPPDLMFDLANTPGIEWYSLQRDVEGALCPENITPLPLGDWVMTAESISSLDLVITSCTSVAHLSAAMGIPTWVIIPILSYYLWALPGETSPYYDSVRLFRQVIKDDWTEPFRRIQELLDSHVERFLAA